MGVVGHGVVVRLELPLPPDRDGGKGRGKSMPGGAEHKCFLRFPERITRHRNNIKRSTHFPGTSTIV